MRGKTNFANTAFWLVGKTVVSATHIYVLVNLQSKEDPTQPEYFVVPSGVIKDRTYEKSPNAEFYSVCREDVKDYMDKWEVFGDPHMEIKLNESTESPLSQVVPPLPLNLCEPGHETNRSTV